MLEGNQVDVISGRLHRQPVRRRRRPPLGRFGRGAHQVRRHGLVRRQQQHLYPVNGRVNDVGDSGGDDAR